MMEMPKVGIIGCKKNWRKGCPGLCSHVLCFEALQHKLGPFENMEQLQLVNMVSCGGCPGDSLTEIAECMVLEENVDLILFPYCVLYNHCPGLASAAHYIESRLNCQIIYGDYEQDPVLSTYLHPYYKRILIHRKIYGL